MAAARPHPRPEEQAPPVPAECAREWREFLAAARAMAEQLARERGAPAETEPKRRRVEG
jgi:hypothetical protein